MVFEEAPGFRADTSSSRKKEEQLREPAAPEQCPQSSGFSPTDPRLLLASQGLARKRTLLSEATPEAERRANQAVQNGVKKN